jgi:SAM-dependent methyltransferase
MEPDNVADYNSKSYWEARYKAEPTFDWFASVYNHALELILDHIARLRERDPTRGPIQVLHLGCGNSRLCRDLYERTSQPTTNGVEPPLIRQIAVDYSATVIENMIAAHQDLPSGAVEWIVDDVLQMDRVASYSCDLVIDKATMDAIQADKESDHLEEDLDAMLRQVSRVLRRSSYSEFLQLTWEIPYYRFHWTKRSDGRYAWGEACDQHMIGDSDLYRLFVYRCEPTRRPEATAVE